MQANRAVESSLVPNPAVLVFKSMASMQTTISELQREVLLLRTTQPNNSIALNKLIRLEEGRQSPDNVMPHVTSALGRFNSYSGLTPMTPVGAEHVALSVSLLRLLIENPFFTVSTVSQSLDEMSKPTDEQIHLAAAGLPIVYPSMQAARDDLFILAKNQLVHIMSFESDAHLGTLTTLLDFVSQCEVKDVGSPRVRVASEGYLSDITSCKIGEPMSATTLRSWATFLNEDTAGHIEVRDGKFHPISAEQIEAYRASSPELVSLPSSHQNSGHAFPFSQSPPPFGYHQPIDAFGLQAAHPYGFPPGAFPSTFTSFPPGFGAGMPAPFAPNLPRPSTVQVSEMSDEKPHIHSFMKHNRSLFDALQAAYPSKAITLLSEPQLKTLLNKYAKEHDKSPAPPPRATRARTTADQELGKKGGKRTRSEEVHDAAEDDSIMMPSARKGRTDTSKVDAEKPKKSKKAKRDKKDKKDKPVEADGVDAVDS